MVMACAAWAAVVLSPASTDPVPDWLLQPGAQTKCWVALIAHHYITTQYSGYSDTLNTGVSIIGLLFLL